MTRPTPAWIRLLLRLLPGAFRDRFGEDLGALIATRPSLREAVSLLWLAIDLRRRQGSPGSSPSLELRGSWRYLTRHRISSLAVILTLAVGFTAALTTVAVARSVLWRPLPFPQADRLVFVWESPADDDAGAPTRVTAARYAEWRDHNTVFADIAAFGAAGLTIDTADGRRAIRGVRVTARYFSVLGVTPAIGRTFIDSDEASGAPPVIVLSHALWTTAFGARRDVIGTAARFGATTYTVIGVMPPIVSPGWPANPAVVSLDREQRQFWVPIARTPQFESSGRAHVLGVVARLAPGRSPADATQALRRTAPSGAPDPHSGVATPFREQFVRDARGPLMLLLAAACAVLLTTATNLAGLQAAAFERRRAEFSVRAALGAGLPRLLRQLLVESLVLSVLGAALALAATTVLLAWLPSRLPSSIPLLTATTVDAPTILIAVGLMLVMSVILCAWPAMRMATAAPAPRGVAGRAGTPIFRSLVIAQITVTVGLISAAALLGASLRNVYGQNAGFAIDHRLIVDLSLPAATNTPESVIAGLGEVTHAVAALPGVRGVAASYDHPLAANWSGVFGLIGDAPTAEGPNRDAELRIVSPSYFATAGADVIDGRAFTDDDVAARPGVALINAAMARSIGGTVIGRQLTTGAPSSWGPPAPAEVTIIGIVEDERFRGLESASRPAVYLSTLQFPQTTLSLIVRTSGDPEALSAAARLAAGRALPSLTVGRVTTLERLLNEQLAARRATTGVVVAFALGTLALAALGLYGLMAVSVDNRRREFGVRVALGASPGSLATDVVMRALRWTTFGVAGGLASSLLTNRLLAGLLFGVQASDPLILALVAAVLAVVTVVATLTPALRAARVDPLEALRGE
jgi:putative ABC transport system permease protein